jgi:hypothetical protein
LAAFVQEGTQVHLYSLDLETINIKIIQKPGGFDDYTLIQLLWFFFILIEYSSLNISSLELKVYWIFVKIWLVGFVSSSFLTGSYSN